MRLMSIVIGVYILFIAVPVLAQTPQPTPAPAFDADTLERLEELVQRAEIAAEQSLESQAAATEAIDHAFNLLGLFEAFGLVVTVVGGAAGIFGFTRLISAQRELAAARERLENELYEYRQSFDSEQQHRRDEVERLSQTMQRAAQEQRHTTSNALLANALIPLGERQYRAQDFTGALNTYLRALELDPANPVVHQRLGYVYTAAGDLQKAKYHYEQAIEREQNFAPALAGLGFVYRRMGEEIEKAMPKDTNDEGYLNKKIERDRRLNQAESLLLQALSLSPRLVDDDGESWWGVLGGLYKRRNQIDEAINAYYQVTVVTPQSSYGFGNLALLYLKRKDIPKMLEMYRRVERIAATEATAESGNFWGYADLIVSRFAIGKIEEANDILPDAIKIAPMDSPYMLSGLYETLEELLVVVPQENIAKLQQAIDMLKSELERRANQRAITQTDTPDDAHAKDETTPV